MPIRTSRRKSSFSTIDGFLLIDLELGRVGRGILMPDKSRAHVCFAGGQMAGPGRLARVTPGETGLAPKRTFFFSVTVCQLVYSINPCKEFSQPSPDCLCPPKAWWGEY